MSTPETDQPLALDDTPAPAKAPRKRATPKAVPAETEQVMAEAEQEATRKRRSLRDLPEGWQYEVVIRSGEDQIVVTGAGISVDLNGRQSTVPVADLADGLDKARGILKTYAAYKEQVLAFDTMLGGDVARGHADAEGVTTAADVEQVVAGEGAGVTVAESEIEH